MKGNEAIQTQGNNNSHENINKNTCIRIDLDQLQAYWNIFQTYSKAVLNSQLSSQHWVTGSLTSTASLILDWAVKQELQVGFISRIHGPAASIRATRFVIVSV